MPFRLLVLLLTFLTRATVAEACSVCRPKVQAGIYTATYSANALVLLLPILLLLGGSLLLYYSPKLSLWKTTTHLPGTGPR